MNSASRSANPNGSTDKAPTHGTTMTNTDDDTRSDRLSGQPAAAADQGRLELGAARSTYEHFVDQGQLPRARVEADASPPPPFAATAACRSRSARRSSAGVRSTSKSAVLRAHSHAKAEDAEKTRVFRPSIAGRRRSVRSACPALYRGSRFFPTAGRTRPLRVLPIRTSSQGWRASGRFVGPNRFCLAIPIRF
jgi:hypothetical protein